MFPLPVISGVVAAGTVVATDTAQTVLAIPTAITQTFQNVSDVIAGAKKFDWVAAGLVALGLLVVMLAIGGILFEETIQKPGRQFIESGGAEKVVKLASKGAL